MKKRRSRIQVGPGGVVFIMITGLILGAAIYTQANLLFWAFGLMVGGLFVSLLLSWQMLRGIQVQRLLPSHGVAGEPMIIRYHLTNRSWLPIFSLVILETWGKGRRGWKKTGPIASRPARLLGRPHGWVLHVGPHQTIQAEAPCWPVRRGRLAFERIVLSSTFPFGVIRKVVEFNEPASVLVFPHLYRINRRMIYTLSNFDPSGRKHLERGGGTEEFFGLRPYREGDPPKMIEWKRSARTGTLISRELTQPSPPRVMVLLDLRDHDQSPKEQPPAVETPPQRKKKAPGPLEISPEALAIERAVSLAASLICEAHFQGYQVGLAVAGAACTTFPVHHSLPHRMRMLEALAQVDPNQPGAGNEMPIGQPSVIVWPGAGESIPGRANTGTTVLGASDMEKYVQEAEGGAEGLLRRRTPVRSRREEMEKETVAVAAGDDE